MNPYDQDVPLPHIGTGSRGGPSFHTSPAPSIGSVLLDEIEAYEWLELVRRFIPLDHSLQIAVLGPVVDKCFRALEGDLTREETGTLSNVLQRISALMGRIG